MVFKRDHLNFRSVLKPALLGVSLLALTACQGSLDSLVPKEDRPVPSKLIRAMKAKGMKADAPIMIRVFKQSSELEVWKQTHTGRYALLASYEICKWSGKLGPKFKEGDRQAPEGFYTVNKHQMNPRSSFHLSFNMGFPNTYDRSHGRTGTHLMVHGACSSAGCYSMTDEQVEVIYALARDAFDGGQKSFQMQAFPFRMTSKNMVKHKDHKHFKFWQMLKRGHDHFEITRKPPKVDVCGKRYVFNTTTTGRYASTQSCPAMKMPVALASAFTKKQEKYVSEFKKLAGKSGADQIAALSPVTFETALPGITVVKPVAKIVAPVEEAKKVEAEEVPVATETPKPVTQDKPATAKPDLEATLKPAG